MLQLKYQSCSLGQFPIGFSDWRTLSLPLNRPHVTFTYTIMEKERSRIPEFKNSSGQQNALIK